jgi:hypothetical protein
MIWSLIVRIRISKVVLTCTSREYNNAPLDGIRKEKVHL